MEKVITMVGRRPQQSDECVVIKLPGYIRTREGYIGDEQRDLYVCGRQQWREMSSSNICRTHIAQDIPKNE